MRETVAANNGMLRYEMTSIKDQKRLVAHDGVSFRYMQMAHRRGPDLVIEPHFCTLAGFVANNVAATAIHNS